ncbi:MAG: tetratricopeptide repeat protein, partial [Promethearchaeia archaeon]
MRKGVQHASDRNYALAIKSYRSAIHLDAQNADAHVALGAAFANTQ